QTPVPRHRSSSTLCYDLNPYSEEIGDDERVYRLKNTKIPQNYTQHVVISEELLETEEPEEVIESWLSEVEEPVNRSEDYLRIDTETVGPEDYTVVD
ncbi:MAG: hypothetical protein ABEJ95_06800, partial [Candidatus Nanohalobium sp.]